MAISVFSEFFINWAFREKLAGVLLRDNELAQEASIPGCFAVTESWKDEDINTNIQGEQRIFNA